MSLSDDPRAAPRLAAAIEALRAAGAEKLPGRLADAFERSDYAYQNMLERLLPLRFDALASSNDRHRPPPRRAVGIARRVEFDMRNALVLLSGGFDSAVALSWAMREFDSVRAVAFDYGQPHRSELAASQVIAERRGIPWTRASLADAVHGLTAIAPPEPGSVDGISRANLPARNAIFLSIAAAEAARAWPGGNVSLVIGATADDGPTFPDCRLQFFEAAGFALSSALCGVVASLIVRAPWVEMGYRKADVLRWIVDDPAALADARLSVSCYRGARCGTCDACTLRASAFAAVGIDDGAETIPVCGGDAAREARRR